jgi:hypothetical protein
MRGGEAADLVRATVRPAVTWCLVAGQVGLVLLWALGYGEAREAAAMLGPFTMMTATFYFKSRDEAARLPREVVEVPRASLTVGAAK